MNWIPTAEGLEIHFTPYQFGIALPGPRPCRGLRSPTCLRPS
jgi:hypothetical protein